MRVVASVASFLFVITVVRTSLIWARLCVVFFACGETYPMAYCARGRRCVLRSATTSFSTQQSLSLFRFKPADLGLVAHLLEVEGGARHIFVQGGHDNMRRTRGKPGVGGG